MLYLTLAGNLGRDAVHKSTQAGKDYCSFPVAATIGWGDKKQTIWIDVTKWGEGSQGLAKLLRKGAKVTVIGELSTREHEGKTYLQCRATDVALQGDAPGGQGGGNNAPPQDDDLDRIPF